MDERRIPPRPRLSNGVASFLNRVNAVFDWFYHSYYNPFYRSGTLAIGLLFVLLATGLYLLLFYSVSDPYGSVVRIHEQVWLGRWIRALHRYATDAALIAVIFHVLQLLAQGKTWGPRTLAWVSGMLLTAALFVSAWTGYVMVWDEHGYLLARSGLDLVQTLPLVSDEVPQAFSGKEQIPASFFFMNLFLHVAIPLAMVAGMWVHTGRLARTVWFPIRSIFYGSLAGLILLSVVVPISIIPQADLLKAPGVVKVDWWFAFWVPLFDIVSPTAVLAVWGVIFLLLLTVPFWWRPPRSSQPPISQVDVDGCTGCIQCARDCPYEAITMVPHPNGKHQLAKISDVHCVSCGICAASCSDFAVGPPGRNAREQVERFDELFSESGGEAADIAIVGCTHNDSMPDFLEAHAAGSSDLQYAGINCCATLHSTTIEKLLEQHRGLLLVGCAARNCMNRDGLDLISGRLYQKRVPFLSRNVDRSRIGIASNSESEKSDVLESLAKLQSIVADEAPAEPRGWFHPTQLLWYFKRTVATGFLLGVMAVLNQFPIGVDSGDAVLRVIARLPAQISEGCRPLTVEEKANLPRHMQKPEICETKPVSYDLRVVVDGSELLRKTVSSGSLRGDLPALIFEEVPVEPGTHQVEVRAGSNLGESGASFSGGGELSFEKGRVLLVELESG